MVIWHKFGGHVIDRLTNIADVYRRHGQDTTAQEIERHIWKLNALRAATKNHPDKSQLRQNYADAFRRVLRRMKTYADDMQYFLGCEWWGNWPNDEAAGIFGLGDMTEPKGIGDGTPILPGYLPYVMKNLILEQTGFLWMGWLKPRMGITGALPAEGYQKVIDLLHKDKSYFDLRGRDALKLTA